MPEDGSFNKVQNALSRNQSIGRAINQLTHVIASGTVTRQTAVETYASVSEVVGEIISIESAALDLLGTV